MAKQKQQQEEPKKDRRTCDGCGNSLDTGVFSGEEYVAITATPEHEILVCGGGRGHRGAKQACVLKALQKISACPGCARQIDWPVETLCDRCGNKIDLADRIQNSEDESRSWRTFKVWELVAQAAHDREERLAAVRILRLAAHASGAPTRGLQDGDDHTHEVRLEITEKQGAAVEELVQAVVDYGRVRYRVGFEEGRSVLLGLAKGSITPDQFAAEEAKKTKGVDRDGDGE